MIENLVLGLISGLVTTLLIVVFKNFWDFVVIPWFEERVYKDIKIEGQWFSSYPDSVSPIRQEVISLKRRGHAINGEIVCTNGPDTGEKYHISGSFRNMMLPLTYESCDSTKSDRGAIALKATKNGKRLVGKIAMYNDITDVVATATIIWFRTNEDLKKYYLSIADRRQEIENLKSQAKEVEDKLNNIEDIKVKDISDDNSPGQKA